MTHPLHHRITARLVVQRHVFWPTCHSPEPAFRPSADFATRFAPVTPVRSSRLAQWKSIVDHRGANLTPPNKHSLLRRHHLLFQQRTIQIQSAPSPLPTTYNETQRIHRHATQQPGLHNSRIARGRRPNRLLILVPRPSICLQSSCARNNCKWFSAFSFSSGSVVCVVNVLPQKHRSLRRIPFRGDLRRQHFHPDQRRRILAAFVKRRRRLRIILHVKVVDESQIVIQAPLVRVRSNPALNQLHRQIRPPSPARRRIAQEHGPKVIHRHQMRIERAASNPAAATAAANPPASPRACSRNIAPLASNKCPPAAAHIPGSKPSPICPSAASPGRLHSPAARLLRINALLQSAKRPQIPAAPAVTTQIWLFAFISDYAAKKSPPPPPARSRNTTRHTACSVPISTPGIARPCAAAPITSKFSKFGST